ncbi:FAR-17a/AIG1-like protein [Pholiota molesta]|nr:FAR-17a/AIG1-like protein [Pholiota molesta]
MERVYAGILHGVAANTMYQGFRSVQKLPIGEFMRVQYGGHFQYLTIQGLALAGFSMVLGMVTGLFPWAIGLKTAKRYLMIVALPVSVVVSLIYWSLLTLFPALIIQPLHSEPSTPSSSSTTPALFYLPLTVDLALHAVPAVSLMLDFFLFERKYDKREVQVIAPIAALTFAIWYGSWVEHCGSMNNGSFPYPFLTENPQEIRIGIYAGATILSLLSFRFINNLHR